MIPSKINVPNTINTNKMTKCNWSAYKSKSCSKIYYRSKVGNLTNVLLILPERGGVQYSIDDGDNWRVAIPGNNDNDELRALCFVSGRVIFARQNGIGVFPEEALFNDQYWNAEAPLDDKVNSQMRGACLSAGEFLVTSSGRIFAPCTQGVFYSDDLGETWHDSFNDTIVYCMCETKTGRLIVGCASNESHSQLMYYSDNNGTTWLPMNNSFVDNRRPKCVELCVLDSGRITALCYTYTTDIYYSDDNGNTWAIKSSAAVGDWKGTCVINRTIIGIRYTGTYSIAYSHNGADFTTLIDANWSVASFKPYSDAYCYVNAICVTPTKKLFLISDRTTSDGPDKCIGIWKANLIYDFTGVSKLLTGEQAKELVRQCKEYVQAKKLELQNNG